MINRSFSLLLFVMMALIVQAKAQPQVVWERYYDTLGASYGNHVIQTSDGGYLVTGGAHSSPVNTDVMITKLDSLGNIQWAKKYGGPNSDGGVGAVELAGGYFFIAASKDLVTTTNSKIWLLKIDPVGDTIWTQTITAGPGSNVPYAIALSLDSGCVISAHTSAIGAGSYDAMIVKCDQMGNQQWIKVFGGGGADVGTSIITSIDHGYVMVGYWRDTSLSSQTFDCYIVKTDSLGDTLWTARIGGMRNDRAFGVVENPDSSLTVAGYTDSYGDTLLGNGYVLKLSYLGNLIWQRNYGGTRGDYFYSISQIWGGDFILGGSTQDSISFDTKGYLVRIDDTGDTLWTKMCSTLGDQEGYYAASTADGGFVLTGKTYQYATFGADLYVVKFDSLGNAPLAQPDLILELYQDMQVYPNPVNDELRVQIFGEVKSPENGTIEICDATGNIVFRQDCVSSETIVIPVQNFSNGMYVIRYFDSEIFLARKIAVQH